jgi:hypothetical protein
MVEAGVARRQPFALTVDAQDTLESDARITPGRAPRIRDAYPSSTLNGIEVAELHATPKPHDAAMLRPV